MSSPNLACGSEPIERQDGFADWRHMLCPRGSHIDAKARVVGPLPFALPYSGAGGLISIWSPTQIPLALDGIYVARPTRASSAYGCSRPIKKRKSPINGKPLVTKAFGSRYENALHLVYHTIAWQYFPHDERAHKARAAGQRATDKAPLRVFQWGPMGMLSASLDLTLCQGAKISLGRVDFHGRWVNWFGNVNPK